MIKKKEKSRRATICSFKVEKVMLFIEIKNTVCIAVVEEGEGTDIGH